MEEEKILCVDCQFAIFKEFNGTDERYMYLSQCLKNNSPTSWGVDKCEFYSKGKTNLL